MPNFISEPKDISDLARQTDAGLSSIEEGGKRGYVGTRFLANSASSYFYTDAGVLKFHNVVTNETSVVTF